MSAFGYRKATDLPQVIAVFPLNGAVLFPRATMPLNIFEPRYLNMIDDALGGQRLIGMIQPIPGGGGERPTLSDVGCVGRITSFAESDDGRYLITLTGVARFRPLRELEAATPYRQVNADWGPFEADLMPPNPLDSVIDRPRLTTALKDYVEAQGFQTDWSAVDQAPPEALVNAIASLCPFEPMEKQALLEARTLDARCAALITLLELHAADGNGGKGPIQ